MASSLPVKIFLGIAVLAVAAFIYLNDKQSPVDAPADASPAEPRAVPSGALIDEERINNADREPGN